MNVAVCLAAATLVGKSFEQKSGAIGGVSATYLIPDEPLGKIKITVLIKGKVFYEWWQCQARGPPMVIFLNQGSVDH